MELRLKEVLTIAGWFCAIFVICSFIVVYLSSTSPSSQTGGCFCFLAIAVTEMLSAVNISTSTISNLIIISQLNHFTFVSALLLPVLRLNLTLPFRLQGLGTGGWLRPYPTGFSCYIQSAYKSKQSFLRSPEEISLADFSARTIFELYKKLPTGSCPELSRSPRYVEYNYIRYAVLWDSGVFS